MVASRHVDTCVWQVLPRIVFGDAGVGVKNHDFHTGLGFTVLLCPHGDMLPVLCSPRTQKVHRVCQHPQSL